MRKEELAAILAVVPSSELREKIFDVAEVEIGMPPARVYRVQTYFMVFKGERGKQGVRICWQGPITQVDKALLRMLQRNQLNRGARLNGIKFSDGSRWSIHFRKSRGGPFEVVRSVISK